MEIEKESGNFAKITLKKSSSSGKLGFDIQVKADGSITQDQLDKIGTLAINTALKARIALGE